MEVNGIMWALGAILIFVVAVILILNGIEGRRSRRDAADSAARAQAFAAKERAKADVQAARAREEARQGAKVKVVGVLFLGFVVFLVWSGITMGNALSEWGEVKRYKARQSTYVELDMGKTVRHGQLMEMMTNKAWAEAYQGRPGNPPNALVWLVFVAAAFFIGVNVWAYRKTGRVPAIEAIVHMGDRGPPTS